MSHDWEYFNNQTFLADLEKINWNQVLQLNQNNINLTYGNYLKTRNALINSHQTNYHQLSRVFSTERGWGGGMEGVSHQLKICSFLPTSKNSQPSRLPLPPPTNFYSPSTKSQFLTPPPPLTRQHFSSYHQIKTSFLAVAIAPVPFLF